ncbi:MAG: hypothetical protein LBD21_10450 [Tannerellaceae bacterium]|jgi:hypothetical protein|nr:hypothetical protein [Tannerellaceae bacterium]
MLQVKTYRLPSYFSRLRNADHCGFFGSPPLGNLREMLPGIPLLIIIYEAFRAIVAREQCMLTGIRPPGLRFMPPESFRECRHRADRAFEILVAALNAAYIMNETGEQNPAVRAALGRTITSINEALARLHQRA